MKTAKQIAMPPAVANRLSKTKGITMPKGKSKITAVSTYSPKVPMHSFFEGDLNAIVKKVHHILGDNKLVNRPHIKHEYLDIQKLNPLFSQRRTRGSFVEACILKRGGYDPFSAGSIRVIQDPHDKQYYVFDGLHRLAMAIICGENKISCEITPLTKKEAAYQFSYTQGEGHRILKTDTAFVSWAASGIDFDAEKYIYRLEYINCHVSGETNCNMPHTSNYKKSYAITFRTLKNIWKFSKGDIELMKLAADLIQNAWPTADTIMYDLFTGLVIFLQVFTDAQDVNSVFHAKFKNFLNNFASNYPISSTTWKKDGGNEHNQEHWSVAKGIALGFGTTIDGMKLLDIDAFDKKAMKKVTTKIDTIFDNFPKCTLNAKEADFVQDKIEKLFWYD